MEKDAQAAEGGDFISTRTITECDRCRHEVKSVTKMTVGRKEVDLCDGCKNKLDLFMSGRELEVPP
jgi:hypothetical protein